MGAALGLAGGKTITAATQADQLALQVKAATDTQATFATEEQLQEQQNAQSVEQMVVQTEKAG
jgi:hypothetical protein